MKRFFETIVEKILMASGAITSLTILLIIIFLFSQGAGLFNTPVVEEGYKLAVNPENPVSDLTPEEIKEIFDGEIVNWAQVGGDDEDIVVFRLNDVTSYVSEEELGEGYSLLPQCLSRIVSENKPIIAFLPDTYIPENFSGKILETGDIKPLCRRAVVPHVATRTSVRDNPSAARNAVGIGSRNPLCIAAGTCRCYIYGRTGIDQNAQYP